MGLDPERLNRLKRTIGKDTEEGIYDGAALIVARHGKIAMYEAVGKTDLKIAQQKLTAYSSSCTSSNSLID
ncbi:MAG: hypothetical protein KIH10_07145 [Candidatus Freyarchaeota archaeon]|nr:hypothetical protein [Candidatus Jordarchaeia archaeon]